MHFFKSLFRFSNRSEPSPEDLGFDYAKKFIPCSFPECSCPAAGNMNYSFQYVGEARKFIYYDVPKAASTTIRRKIGVRKPPHPTSLIDPRKPRSEYFKFSVVRNPWSRLVSNWTMFTNAPGRIQQIKSVTDRDLSKFEEFVDFAFQTPNHHWQPQTLFVPSDLNFIGRMESLDEALSVIGASIKKFDTTNVALNYSKKGRSSSDSAGYRAFYSDKIAERTAQFYAEDIERFGYDF